MENRLKLRISRMFSFGSCRPRNVSDAVEKAVFSPQDPQAAHLLRPAAEPRPLPSLCRPTCPDPTKSINPTCIISAKKDAVSRRRVLPSEHRRQYYFPLSPASSSFYRAAAPKQSREKKKEKEKKKKKKKEKGKKKCHQSRPLIITTSSQDTNTTHDWFSSDDEREEEDDYYGDRDRGCETETLFSSISLSSDDSSAARRRHRRRRRKATHSRRITTVADPPEEKVGSNIKGSFAVVKKSSDPHGDFRASMVEMIVERQLFGAEELERLLRCFLALNSGRHHAVIVEVFTEIWETLFSSSRSPGVHWS